jgi:hypothetical protein
MSDVQRRDFLTGAGAEALAAATTATFIGTKIAQGETRVL